jgi:uncharacterized damage-inducible protein DinB
VPPEAAARSRLDSYRLGVILKVGKSCYASDHEEVDPPLAFGSGVCEPRFRGQQASSQSSQQPPPQQPPSSPPRLRFRFEIGSGAGDNSEAIVPRSYLFLGREKSVIVTRMTPPELVEDQRYPIGDFRRSNDSTPEIRAEQIQILRLLPEQLKAAIAGLDESQLNTPYRDGGWTVRQVIHHVADSHANSYVRTKLALTEDWPIIKPYDEAAWAKLPDTKLPVAASLDLITALHARWVELLELLTDEDFQRGYTHPQNGKQNLAQVLALYAWHSRHHTAHITNLRSRMGW